MSPIPPDLTKPNHPTHTSHPSHASHAHRPSGESNVLCVCASIHSMPFHTMALFAIACVDACVWFRVRREYLNVRGELADYMALLDANFNANAAEGVMCRSLVSVGWDGAIYDCDFNQQMDMGLRLRERDTTRRGGGKGEGKGGVTPHAGGGSPQRPTVFDIASFSHDAFGDVRLAQHCFGCTAGCGSSCSGQ